MPRPGLQVAVVFGGRSVEHDVSIITGLQACEVLSERHQPVPVYVDRAGRWHSGEALRSVDTYRTGVPDDLGVSLDLGRGVLSPAAAPPRGGLLRRAAVVEREPLRPDVIIPATHGTQGEDGCLQGAFELADLPYAGPTLESAALAMNKAVTKSMLRAADIPVLDDLTVRRYEYEQEGAEAVASRAESRFGLPVFVKPASLGSSVGVTRCATHESLVDALELAFELDRLALIEPAVEDGMEINCAVLGRPGVTPRTSACEQPIASDGFLSFEDKYMRQAKDRGGGAAKSEGMVAADRLIPAPISEAQTAAVRELAQRTFTVLGCAGVVRVDMLVDSHGRLFVNEPNTIPGSFSFYLWEPVGLAFVDLMDELIDIALAEYAEKQRTTRTFESNLLAMRAAGAKA